MRANSSLARSEASRQPRTECRRPSTKRGGKALAHNNTTRTRSATVCGVVRAQTNRSHSACSAEDTGSSAFLGKPVLMRISGVEGRCGECRIHVAYFETHTRRRPAQSGSCRVPQCAGAGGCARKALKARPRRGVCATACAAAGVRRDSLNSMYVFQVTAPLRHRSRPVQPARRRSRLDLPW